ncbi:MAG: 2-amino-4-hydroxy-6-hydroxymethyldihydropteridine diphosphokinase [Alphaproteobacteria bacterium]
MIVIALGANLRGPGGASPADSCERALAAMSAVGVRIVACSSWYRTRPVGGPPGQPWFVNGVATAESGLGPFALLAALHRIEAAFGRVRGVTDGPRPLDLDLVDYHGLVRRGPPGPTLPHPRSHLRHFVLVPLAEIAPAWRHPVLGATAHDLLASLPDEDGLRRLPRSPARRRFP